MCKKTILNYDSSKYNFKTISEFKWAVDHGSEIVFTYNNKDYSITHPDGLISICEENKFSGAKDYTNSEDVLNHLIDGKKLREIIKEVIVWDRTI